MSTALKKPASAESSPVVADSKNKDRSLTFSLYDGFFYSLMVGFSETYFSAFAVFMGANNFQLAMLAVLPPFCGGLSQFFTLKILDRMGSRQQMVCRFALAQGLFLVPVALSFFAGGVRAEVFLIAVICYYVSGQVVGPVDAGGSVYYFTVVSRKAATLPTSADYAKLSARASEEAAKSKNLPKDVTFEKTADNAGKTSYAQVLTAALEIHRSNIRIIRYNQTAEKPE